VITKRLIVAAALLVLLAGCGGSQYAAEETLLNSVAGAMETFNSAIAAAQTPEAAVSALTQFTGSIENYAADIKALNEAHPEWETDPPEELKATMDKFEAISKSFQTETMPKVMQIARDNPDDENVKTAVQEFGRVMSQL
jgi:ABC-type glycerol-3-phosphate transport system substrate-binding protein